MADYGQLELRVLAHIANDAAMLRAFELGAFHINESPVSLCV